MTVAYVFSGGANLGPMQAGTVAALAEAGIEPELLVGASVGALNAAFLCSRPGTAGAQALIDAWNQITRRDVLRFNPATAFAGLLGFSDHLASSAPLRRLARRWSQIQRVEDAPVPLAIVATDALNGEPVVLRTGDITETIMASTAVPGVYPPVRLGGRYLIDGALSANRPILQAQALGATDIFVIATGTAPRPRPPQGAIAAAMHAVAQLTNKAAEGELFAANEAAAATGTRIWVTPVAEPTPPGPFSTRHSAALAEVAYQHARQWLANDCPGWGHPVPGSTPGRKPASAV